MCETQHLSSDDPSETDDWNELTERPAERLGGNLRDEEYVGGSNACERESELDVWCLLLTQTPFPGSG